MGRPTCYEEEVESWIYKRKPGEDRDEGVPDDDCDEHALDAARYDEVLSFARGFGQDLRPIERHHPDDVRAEAEQIKKLKKRDRDGKRRFGWQ